MTQTKNSSRGRPTPPRLLVGELEPSVGRGSMFRRKGEGISGHYRGEELSPSCRAKIFSFWFLFFFHWLYTPKRLLFTEHISRINICLAMSRNLEKNGKFLSENTENSIFFFVFLKMNFWRKKSRFFHFFLDNLMKITLSSIIFTFWSTHHTRI